MSHESRDRNKTLLLALAAQSTLHGRGNHRTRDRATAMHARALGKARGVGSDAGEDEGVVPIGGRRAGQSLAGNTPASDGQSDHEPPKQGLCQRGGIPRQFAAAATDTTLTHACASVSTLPVLRCCRHLDLPLPERAAVRTCLSQRSSTAPVSLSRRCALGQTGGRDPVRGLLSL